VSTPVRIGAVALLREPSPDGYRPPGPPRLLA
jgi:hypothetical protein